MGKEQAKRAAAAAERRNKAGTNARRSTSLAARAGEFTTSTQQHAIIGALSYHYQVIMSRYQQLANVWDSAPDDPRLARFAPGSGYKQLVIFSHRHSAI